MAILRAEVIAPVLVPPPRLTVPARMVVRPVKVFAPDSVSVPLPVLVNVPDPEPMAAEMVVLPEPVTARLIPVPFVTVAPETVKVLAELLVHVWLALRVTGEETVEAPEPAAIVMPVEPMVSWVPEIVIPAVLDAPKERPAMVAVPAFG